MDGRIIPVNGIVYFKTQTILGESDSVLFAVYVGFMDKDSAREIQAGDLFETFIVRDANNNYVRLTNQNPISLAKNTESLILGKIFFKIADNDTLRFYPKVDRGIPDNSQHP